MSLFLLAGVEETLQVIVNVTANEIRAAKLVPIIIKKGKTKPFLQMNALGTKMNALIIEKTRTRMEIMMD